MPGDFSYYVPFIGSPFTEAMVVMMTSSKIEQLSLRPRDPDRGSAVLDSVTNHPSWNTDGDVSQATRNITLPGRAPYDPSRVMINTWSDGGSWSGMSVGTTTEMHIQWIDFVYNSTDITPVQTPGVPGFPGFPASPGNPGQNPGSESGPSCANVCSIDQTSKIGTPVLISAPQGGQNPGGGGQTPGGCASAKSGQCAGKTWNGCTSCAAGSTCQFQNDYYSQCL
ncbi:carbohydrate-binding module family 1 protein [Biscogniauxia mediterranea]|nr:carbohydrate-binding module family 1 protein [Biscogniauxia mediterranea]